MRALALALAAACANPSPLDRVPVADVDDAIVPWRTIAHRARPIDPAAAELDAALTGTDIEVPAELARRTASLEAWVAAHGRFVELPAVRALEQTDRALALGSLAIAIVKASAADDRALEAALYVAQQLRQNGDSLVAAMAAVAVQRLSIARRPQAPAFAAAYAPTDAEVIRLIYAEAIAVSRLVAWSRSEDAANLSVDGHRYGDLAARDPLGQWAWLAAAPADRAGFALFLARHARSAPPDDPTRSLPEYADKLFGAVDDYRKWLEAAHQPDAGAVLHQDR